MAHQRAHQAFLAFFLFLAGERLGFFHAATQKQRHYRTQGTDDERDAPAPGIQLLGGQGLLQHNQYGQRDELTGNQRDVLKAGEETATLFGRHLAEVGGRSTVLAADRQALQQSGEHQQDRSTDANAFVARGQGDDQRAETHQQHRRHQRGLAPFVVSVQPHQPATDRSHQKADGEDRGGVEQLGGGVALGEERFGKVQRESCVDVPVVPLDHVADRATENGLETAGGGFLTGDAGCWPVGGGVGGFHGVPCLSLFLE
ncbi:hypothetical protein ALP75_204342 [Pseudomonas syringae pv. actinidiae]|nr:hypothetical protein ALP75_204342 [Pseudomonas syringae pv. actinidiae]